MASEIKVPVRLEVLQDSISSIKSLLSNLKPDASGWKELNNILRTMEKEATNLQTTMAKPFGSQAQFNNAEKSVNKLDDALERARITMGRIKFSDIKLNPAETAELNKLQEELKNIETEVTRFKASLKQNLQLGDMWDQLVNIDPNAVTHSFDEIVKTVQNKVKTLQSEAKKAQEAFNDAQAGAKRGDMTKQLLGDGAKNVISQKLDKNIFNEFFQNTKNGLAFKSGQKSPFYEWVKSNLLLSDAQFKEIENLSAKALQEKLSQMDFSKNFTQATQAQKAGASAQTTASNKTAEFEQAKAVLALLGVELDKVAEKQASMGARTAEATGKIQQFKDRLTEGRRALLDTGGASNQMKVALNSLRTSLQQANGDFLKLQRTTQTFNQMKMAIVNFMGFNQVLNLTKRAVKEALSHIKELDTVMNRISIVTDMSTSDLWKQVDAYSKMAQTYGVSIKGAYEVSQIYYQQGLKTNDVLTLTNETLKLSKISGLDYAQTTDYMTTAIRGFKMEMSEASTVVDVYSNLAAHTAVSQEELAVAMSKTASSMESVGSTFEESSAMIATMVAVTRESATNIGSALKSIAARYGEMKKDPLSLVDADGEVMAFNKVDSALQSVGISMKTADGQFREFTDVIVELSEKWNTLESTQQRYIATQFAGNRQQSRFLALVSNADLLKSNINTANNSEDTGTLQALKTLDSIESKLEQVQVAYQQFYTTIGLENVWKASLDGLKNYINYLNSLPKLFGKLPLGAIAVASNVIGILKMLGENLIGSIARAWQAGLSRTQEETQKTNAGQELINQLNDKSGEIRNAGREAGRIMGQGFSEGVAEGTSQTVTTLMTKAAAASSQVGASTAQQQQTGNVPTTSQTQQDIAQNTQALNNLNFGQMIQDRITTTGIDLSAITSNTQNAIAAIIQTVVNSSADMYKAFSALGDYAAQGYLSGLLQQQGIGPAAGQIAAQAIEGIRSTQQSNSPSKVTMALGNDAVDGYILGLVSKMDAALQSGKNLSQKSIDGLAAGINEKGFNEIRDAIVAKLDEALTAAKPEDVSQKVWAKQQKTLKAERDAIVGTTFEMYQQGKGPGASLMLPFMKKAEEERIGLGAYASARQKSVSTGKSTQVYRDLDYTQIMSANDQDKTPAGKVKRHYLDLKRNQPGKTELINQNYQNQRVIEERIRSEEARRKAEEAEIQHQNEISYYQKKMAENKEAPPTYEEAWSRAEIIRENEAAAAGMPYIDPQKEADILREEIAAMNAAEDERQARILAEEQEKYATRLDQINSQLKADDDYTSNPRYQRALGYVKMQQTDIAQQKQDMASVLSGTATRTDALGLPHAGHTWSDDPTGSQWVAFEKARESASTDVQAYINDYIRNLASGKSVMDLSDKYDTNIRSQGQHILNIPGTNLARELDFYGPSNIINRTRDYDTALQDMLAGNGYSQVVGNIRPLQEMMPEYLYNLLQQRPLTDESRAALEAEKASLEAQPKTSEGTTAMDDTATRETNAQAIEHETAAKKENAEASQQEATAAEAAVQATQQQTGAVQANSETITNETNSINENNNAKLQQAGTASTELPKTQEENLIPAEVQPTVKPGAGEEAVEKIGDEVKASPPPEVPVKPQQLTMDGVELVPNNEIPLQPKIDPQAVQSEVESAAEASHGQISMGSIIAPDLGASLGEVVDMTTGDALNTQSITTLLNSLQTLGRISEETKVKLLNLYNTYPSETFVEAYSAAVNTTPVVADSNVQVPSVAEQEQAQLEQLHQAYLQLIDDKYKNGEINGQERASLVSNMNELKSVEDLKKAYEELKNRKKEANQASNSRPNPSGSNVPPLVPPDTPNTLDRIKNKFGELKSFIGANQKAVGNWSRAIGMGLSSVTSFIDTTTHGGEVAKNAVVGIGGAISAVGAIISHAGPMAIITAVTTMLTSVLAIIKSNSLDAQITRAEKRAEELSNKAKEAKAEYKTLDTGIKKLDELTEKRYESAESTEEYQTAVDELAEKFPQLITGFDDAGNILIDTTNAEETLAKARQASAKATFEAAQEELNAAKLKLQKNMSSISSDEAIGYTESTDETSKVAKGIYNYANKVNEQYDNQFNDLVENMILSSNPKVAASNFYAHYQATDNAEFKDEFSFLERGIDESGAFSVSKLKSELETNASDLGESAAEFYETFFNNNELILEEFDSARQAYNSLDSTATIEERIAAFELMREKFDAAKDANAFDEETDEFKQTEESIADIAESLGEYSTKVREMTGIRKKVIGSWQQTQTDMGKPWEYLEESAAAAALVTKTIDDVWTRAEANGNTYTVSDTNYDIILRQWNGMDPIAEMNDFWLHLSDTQQKLFDEMFSDTQNYTAEDFEEVFGKIPGFDKIMPMINSYYNDGIESISKRLNAELAKVLGRKADSEGNFAQIDATEFKENTFFRTFAEAKNKDNITRMEESQLNAILDQYDELSKAGYQGRAESYGLEAMSLFSQIDAAPAEIEKRLWKIVEENGLNTLEGLQKVKDSIANDSELAKYVDTTILDRLQNNIIPNINLEIQTATSNLLDTWEDTSKQLKSALNGGISLKEADELIQKANSMGLDFDMSDFKLVGDKLVLVGESFDDYYKTLTESAETTAEQWRSRINEAKGLAADLNDKALTQSDILRSDSYKALLKSVGFNWEDASYWTAPGNLSLTGQEELRKALEQNEKDLDNYNMAAKIAAQQLLHSHDFSQGIYKIGETKQSVEDLEKIVGANVKLGKDQTEERAIKQSVNSVYSNLLSDVVSKGLENINLDDYEGLVQGDMRRLRWLTQNSNAENVIREYATLAGKSVEEIDALLAQNTQKTTSRFDTAIKELLNYSSDKYISDTTKQLGVEVNNLNSNSEYAISKAVEFLGTLSSQIGKAGYQLKDYNATAKSILDQTLFNQGGNSKALLDFASGNIDSGALTDLADSFGLQLNDLVDLGTGEVIGEIGKYLNYNALTGKYDVSGTLDEFVGAIESQFNIKIDKTSQAYVEVLKAWNDKAIKKEHEIDEAVTDELKSISEIKPGGKVNLAQTYTTLLGSLGEAGMEFLTASLQGMGATLTKDGILAISEGADIPGIIQAITSEASEAAQLLPEQIAELKDAVEGMLSDITSIVNKGIDGKLSNVDAEKLNSWYRDQQIQAQQAAGLSPEQMEIEDLSFTRTVDGLKLANDEIRSLYQTVKDIDAIQGEIIFEQLKDNLIATDDNFKDVQSSLKYTKDLMQEIGELERQPQQFKTAKYEYSVAGSGGRAPKIEAFDSLKGNVNMYNRPWVEQEDGTHQTIYSETYQNEKVGKMSAHLIMTPIPEWAKNAEDILTDEELSEYVTKILDQNPMSLDEVIKLDAEGVTLDNGRQVNKMLIDIKDASATTTAELRAEEQELHEWSEAWESARRGIEAPDNEERLKALKEELELAQKIQNIRATSEDDSFKFMENKIPAGQNNPLNYMENWAKAYEAIKKSTSGGKGEKGYMEYEDFYNIITEMGHLADQTGQLQIDGNTILHNSEEAANLITKAAGHLKVTADGKMKVDLSGVGIDFKAGAKQMNKDVDAGIDAIAKSQMDMLDSMIKLLEVVVAMEQLGTIDIDNDNFLDLKEIFDIDLPEDEAANLAAKGELLSQNYKDACDSIIKMADSADGKDLKEALQSVRVQGQTMYDILNDAKNGQINLNMTMGEYQQLVNAFYQMAISDDYDLDNIADSIYKIFDASGAKDVSIDVGTKTFYLNGDNNFVIDWDNEKAIKAGEKALDEFITDPANKDLFDPDWLTKDKTIQEKIAGINKLLSDGNLTAEQRASLELDMKILSGEVNIEKKNGKWTGTYKGKTFSGANETEIREKIQTAMGMESEGFTFDVDEKDGSIKGTMNIGNANITVTDDNGVKTYTAKAASGATYTCDTKEEALAFLASEGDGETGSYTFKDKTYDVFVDAKTGISYSVYEDENGRHYKAYGQTFDTWEALQNYLAFRKGGGVPEDTTDLKGNKILSTIVRGRTKLTYNYDTGELKYWFLTPDGDELPFASEQEYKDYLSAYELSGGKVDQNGNPEFEMSGAIVSVDVDTDGHLHYTAKLANNLGTITAESEEGLKLGLATVAQLHGGEIVAGENAKGDAHFTYTNDEGFTLDANYSGVISTTGDEEAAEKALAQAKADVQSNIDTKTAAESFNVSISNLQVDAASATATVTLPESISSTAVPKIIVSDVTIDASTATAAVTMPETISSTATQKIALSNIDVDAATATAPITMPESISSTATQNVTVSNIDVNASTATANITLPESISSTAVQNITVSNIDVDASTATATITVPETISSTAVPNVVLSGVNLSLSEEAIINATSIGEQIRDAIQEALNVPIVPNIQTPVAPASNPSPTPPSSSGGGGGAPQPTAPQPTAPAASAIVMPDFSAAISAIGTVAATVGGIKTEPITDVAKASKAITVAHIQSFKFLAENISSKAVTTFKNTAEGISTSGVDKVQSKLSNLTATVKTDVIGSSASGTIRVKVESAAKGNVGALAKGNLAFAGGTSTLMGELGPELVVSNGRYFIAGQTGAEFVDLDKDAIVFNHKQTERLMSQGMISSRGVPFTNETNAISFAKGNTSGPARVRDAGGGGGGKSSNSNTSSPNVKIQGWKETGTEYRTFDIATITAAAAAKGTGVAMASASAALAALKQLRAMWESLRKATAKDLAGLGGSHGGGGGSGAEETKAFIKQLEKWYNWLQKINEYEIKINKQEALRNKLISDRSKDGHAYYKSQKESLYNLQAEINTTRSLFTAQSAYFKKRQKELNEDSPFRKLYTFDDFGQLQYGTGKLAQISKLLGTNEQGKPNMTAKEQVNYITGTLGISKEYLQYDSSGNKIKDNDYAAMVQAFWDKIEADQTEMQSLFDSKNNLDQKLLELQQQQNELMKEMQDNQVELEDAILDAIVESRQRAIDKLTDIKDAYSDATNKMVNGLSNALNKEREQYDQNQSEAELLQLRRRLALLQRSGGSASEIASLRKDISEREQNAYFDEQQRQIDAIQEAADKQIQRLDEQINILTQTLEYQKKFGLLWDEVYKVMAKSPEQIASYIMTNTEDYWDNSSIVKARDADDWLFKAQQWKDFRRDLNKKDDLTSTQKIIQDYFKSDASTALNKSFDSAMKNTYGDWITKSEDGTFSKEAVESARSAFQENYAKTGDFQAAIAAAQSDEKFQREVDWQNAQKTYADKYGKSWTNLSDKKKNQLYQAYQIEDKEERDKAIKAVLEESPVYTSKERAQKNFSAVQKDDGTWVIKELTGKKAGTGVTYDSAYNTMQVGNLWPKFVSESKKEYGASWTALSSTNLKTIKSQFTTALKKANYILENIDKKAVLKGFTNRLGATGDNDLIWSVKANSKKTSWTVVKARKETKEPTTFAKAKAVADANIAKYKDYQKKIKAGKNPTKPKYSTKYQYDIGGMVEDTGMAFLHAKESVLTSQQTDILRNEILGKQNNSLLNLLLDFRRAYNNFGDTGVQATPSIIIENASVNMHVDQIANDYDARRAGEQALAEMLKIARKNGATSTLRR